MPPVAGSHLPALQPGRHFPARPGVEQVQRRRRIRRMDSSGERRLPGLRRLAFRFYPGTVRQHHAKPARAGKQQCPASGARQQPRRDATCSKTEDANNTDDELLYTLLTTPQHGELHLNGSGTAMVVGDQMTQTDLNNGGLRYFHYGTDATPDDCCLR